MSFTNIQKKEVLRLYLNESNLLTISKIVKITEDDVIQILLENETTKELVLDQYRKKKEGESVNFFYRSKQGREPLPESKKRKPKQIRISDEEMKAIGNPSTTQMRNMMLKYKTIEEFCNMLDENGITLIPDEWLEDNYEKSDPFWKSAVYESNFTKLSTLISDKKIWENIKG